MAPAEEDLHTINHAGADSEREGMGLCAEIFAGTIVETAATTAVITA